MFLYVFHARTGFETTIEVDTGQFRVAEVPEGFCAVGVDTAAEQERRLPFVGGEYRPVELFA